MIPPMMEAKNFDERQDENNESRDKGLNAEFITLISREEEAFVVKREEAMLSGKIKAILTGPGYIVEKQTNVIHFPEIRSEMLIKVCEYMKFRKTYKNAMFIPLFPLTPEIIMELLLVSHYLDL